MSYLKIKVNKTYYYFKVQDVLRNIDKLIEVIKSTRDADFTNHINYYNENKERRGTISLMSLHKNKDLIKFSKEYKELYPINSPN